MFEEEKKKYVYTVVLPVFDSVATYILQHFDVDEKIVMPCSKVCTIVITYVFFASEDEYREFLVFASESTDRASVSRKKKKKAEDDEVECDEF